MYAATLTCETFISKGGRVFEILPKIRANRIFRQKSSVIEILNLRSVLTETLLRFKFWGITNYIFLCKTSLLRNKMFFKCFNLSIAVVLLPSVSFY